MSSSPQFTPEPARPVEADVYPDAWDEMVTGAGAVRNHWRGLLGAISALPRGALAERAERARHQFAENGVTYNIYADPRAGDRPYRFDVVPLVIDAEEWSGIEAGLIQRARLMEALLADAYGPQDFVREGLYPAPLLYANPEFLRPCRRALPPGHRHLGLYVVDLLRGGDGRWRVLADRTHAPAGLGFALENRRVLSRTFPEGFRAASVRSLRPFFDLWQASLQRAAAPGATNPRGVVLSPGPGSDTYFEHIYLARELGLMLTEGADLTARDGKVFLKTLGGLQQVDVILRRIDGRKADPLELDDHSEQGVTGLIDAVRAGAVVVVNALGSGLVETPAFAPYLADLCRRALGEDPLLASTAEVWLGAPGAIARAREDFDRQVVRDTWNVRAAPRIVGQLTAAERTALWGEIGARPDLFVTQPFFQPSVSPTWTPSGLQPRPVILRTFVIPNGDGFAAMPGGLARVPGDGNPFQASLKRGGLAKDVWVMSAERASFTVPGPRGQAEIAIRRTSGELPSRAADNLFWLGRYGERLDVSGRILRAALLRLVGGGLGARDMLELGVLAQVARANGLIETQAAASQPDSRVLAAALTDHAVVRALGGIFGKIEGVVSPVRDRFSSDMWSVLGHLLNDTRDRLVRAAGDPDRLLGALSGLLRAGAAVAGMASENMTRGTGWRFFDLGRRLERAIQTVMAITQIMDYPGATADAALGLVLELCDSTITYRTRYLASLQPGLVLDLVLADETNPRSVAYQLAAISGHLREVPGTVDLGAGREASADLAITEKTLETIRRVDYPSLRSLSDMSALQTLLEEIARELQIASDALTRRHFSHVAQGQAYVYEAGE